MFSPLRSDHFGGIDEKQISGSTAIFEDMHLQHQSTGEGYWGVIAQQPLRTRHIGACHYVVDNGQQIKLQAMINENV